MSPKNLNVSNKTHKFLLNKLKDKQTFQIYKKFEKNLNIKENFIVAVSGGPDSQALSYLAKIYSIKKLLNVKYFIVDHKLREESTLEGEERPFPQESRVMASQRTARLELLSASGSARAS